MSQTILVIGANKGIGLELAKQYSQLGHQVIATCRQVSAPLSAMNCNIIDNIDVTNDNSIKSLVSALINVELDIIIHNSGILESDTIASVTMASMQQHFNVNALGPLRTTLALLENLKAGGKVGIVTSRVGSINDNSSSNNYAYRTSKCAANMIGKCLSIDLMPHDIAVAMLHPGYVRTEMTKQHGLINAEESARGLISIMQDLTLANTGNFYHTNGEQLSW